MNQEKVEPLQAPTEDPAIAALVERGRSRITSTAGVKVLQDLDIGGNLQYATVQMLVQMALGAITPYKNVAENALSQIGTRMLEWVVFNEDEITAFYLEDFGNDEERSRGAQITIKPDEVDVDTAAERSRGHIKTFAQFFAGPHSLPLPYEVIIGRDPARIHMHPRRCAHEYIVLEAGTNTCPRGVMQDAQPATHILIPRTP